MRSVERGKKVTVFDNFTCKKSPGVVIEAGSALPDAPILTSSKRNANGVEAVASLAGKRPPPTAATSTPTRTGIPIGIERPRGDPRMVDGRTRADAHVSGRPLRRAWKARDAAMVRSGKGGRTHFLSREGTSVDGLDVTKRAIRYPQLRELPY